MTGKRLPWYHDGLRFQCSGCGDCCSGEPGAVWVNEAEVVALAAELELSREVFAERYLRQLDERAALVEQPSGDCIFLDATTRGCQVYGARPVQCRTWPFWPQNVGRREHWEKTCEVCPGAGTGPLRKLDEIEDQLGELMQARRAAKG